MLIALLAACFDPAPPAAPPEPRFRQDWALLYWLPYDNDLDPAADPVLAQLRRGTAGREGLEVAAMVDRAGPGGMQLWTFAGGAGRVYPYAELEDSGDGRAFRAFLEHAGALFEARRYLIATLDHGGRLDELSSDLHPGDGGDPWLRTPDVARAIEDFRASEPGEVELVFLQVCSKATLETAWTFRDAGRLTMASQLALGAPNTYYERLGQVIQPDWTGADVVAAIAGADGRDMFASYTCVDNAALADLPARLAPLLAGGPPAGLNYESLAEVTYAYASDTYTDLGALAAAIGRLDPARTQAAEDFSAWLGDAICAHPRSPDPPELLTVGYPDPAALSGLSLYVPPGPLPPRYRALDVYDQAGLDGFVEGLAAGW